MGDSVAATAAEDIFTINEKIANTFTNNHENKIVLGEFYAGLRCARIPLYNILQIFKDYQDESLVALKEKLSLENLNDLAVTFEVLSKIAFWEYANQLQISYQLGKYNNQDVIFLLEPDTIKLYTKISSFFKRLAEDKNK